MQLSLLLSTQALIPLLTELQRVLGAASSEEQETWDPWEAVPPLRGPAPTDKETACVAWAMWCSPSFPGTSEAHLQPPEGSWGDLQRDGPQAAGAMARSSSTRPVLTTDQYLVPLCQEQLLDVNPIWHKVLPIVHHMSKPRLALQQTLIFHRWLREGTARGFQ